MDDKSDSHSPMDLVFQMQLGSISSINDRLDLKASLPFRFKLMNTCDGKVTMSRRGGYLKSGQPAPLTNDGTYTIVARKNQMRPLRKGSVCALRKYHD
jgi:hypothetical protein